MPARAPGEDAAVDGRVGSEEEAEDEAEWSITQRPGGRTVSNGDGLFTPGRWGSGGAYSSGNRR